MRMWEAGGGGEERKKQAWKERTATMAAAEGPEARMALRCVPAPRRGWTEVRREGPEPLPDKAG